VLVAAFALGRPEVGGLTSLIGAVGASKPDHLDFIPTAPGFFGTARLTFTAFVVFVTVRWWAQVYGGAEPGGASHVAQRMLSARNERHAIFGTLWFNVAHYALRPWPWILTGLACLLIFPDATGGADGERAYIRCLKIVPAGLKGLVLAGFFSALMAIDTRLNLGAAYFVNDFYRPYLVPDRDEHHYVNVSRVITVVQMLMALSMFWMVSEVRSVFNLTLAIGSGTGLVFLLRWYWWRINAWSEITAMAAGVANTLVFRFVIYPDEKTFNAHALTVQLAAIVVVTIVWVLVTLLTPATDVEQLKAFYRKVRPAGRGWARIARLVNEEGGEGGIAIDPGYSMSRALVCWLSAVGLVYSVLFGTGKLLLGEPACGAALLAAGLLFLLVLWQALRGDRASVALGTNGGVVSGSPR
jgi:SSS family solute:Na+ symporter